MQKVFGVQIGTYIGCRDSQVFIVRRVGSPRIVVISGDIVPAEGEWVRERERERGSERDSR